MTSADIKAGIDHAFGDVESLATEIGHPEKVKTLEEIKAFLEQPLVLELLSLGASFGIAKLLGPAAEATTEPAKAPTGAPSA